MSRELNIRKVAFEGEIGNNEATLDTTLCTWCTQVTSKCALWQ